MIHFEGVQSFPLPVAEVAAKLSDAGFLANCVPDAQISEATPDKSVGKIKPKLSFLTGSLTLEANQQAEPVHGEGAAIAIHSGKVRSEGKDYVVADGDVMEFRFNV